MSGNRWWVGVLLGWLVLAGLARAADTGAHRPEGIAWHDGDIDSAFERARREDRPVFVYWGAVWCPPCNQLKATLFNRADFQQRAKSFVPVYIDGDAPGAQQLGTRFKVRGYPTTIVLRPDGSEITRLPGEVDPQRYLDVLAAALTATHSVQSLRDDALGGRRVLSADEWRLLAYYSWDTDEQQLAPKGQAASVAAQLARACPGAQGPLCDRLVLQAMSLRAEQTEAADAADATTRATVRRVLADADQAYANFDLLVYGADHAAAWLGTGRPADETAALVRAWDAALARLADDARLSETDRLSALDARLILAKRGDDKAPVAPALTAAARAAVARADRDAHTAAERQTVISAAADVLSDAGLSDEADQLLRRELGRSAAPYYFMLDLAENARKRGDTLQALTWYAQAHEAARGPATRLQWGAAHVRALTELTPEDVGAVERTAASVLAELTPEPENFEGRNLAVLQRLGARLSAWGQAQAHAAAWLRVRAQWQALCERLPQQAPQRASCAASL